MLTSEGNRRPNRVGHLIPVDLEKNIYRILTPVEAERLNGFQDDWTNGMPEKWRYFCMGNALVVGLVEQMGRRLKEEISSIRSIDDGALEIRSERGEVKGPLDTCLEEIAASKKSHGSKKRRFSSSKE